MTAPFKEDPMRYASIMALLLVGISSPVFADPSHHGHGHEDDALTPPAQTTAGHIAHDVTSAALDELEGRSKPARTTDVEPMRRMPPGLEKKGKTPPGWSHGKKEGWEKREEAAEPHESVWSRMTHVILHNNRSADTSSKTPQQKP